MKRRAVILNYVLILCLVVFLILFFYMIYDFIPQENKTMGVNIITEDLLLSNDTKAYNELKMFIEGMRFDSANISYYLFSDCNAEKKQGMKEALNILKNETGVLDFHEILFYDNNHPPQISVYCSEYKKKNQNNSFVAGEGGPDRLLNLSLYPLIISGEVYLYQNNKKLECEYPIVELHELLHVFGFDHLNSSSSVLYPYLSCEQRLNNKITARMVEIYEREPLAEIYFEKANVSKGGIYLNFEVEIFNRGLIVAKNVQLDLYEIESYKKIGNFSLGDIEPGITKTIKLTNFVLPSNRINRIEFRLTSETQEYFIKNNVFESGL